MFTKLAVRLQGGFDLSGGSGMFGEEIWGSKCVVGVVEIEK